MAYGSMRPMRSEANKVFGRDAKPAHMSDGRVDPLVPLGAVLSRWQWGWVRPTPSTEQIGERLGDERWRAPSVAARRRLSVAGPWEPAKLGLRARLPAGPWVPRGG